MRGFHDAMEDVSELLFRFSRITRQEDVDVIRVLPCQRGRNCTACDENARDVREVCQRTVDFAIHAAGKALRTSTCDRRTVLTIPGQERQLELARRTRHNIHSEHVDQLVRALLKEAIAMTEIPHTRPTLELIGEMVDAVIGALEQQLCAIHLDVALRRGSACAEKPRLASNAREKTRVGK